MTVHLVNPSHLSFGVGVITPRWLFVLGAATPPVYGRPRIVDETLEPLDLDTVHSGDTVGIGIHTGNALRGYEIGVAARARGATVVFGGIHATLYPDEAHELGGAHTVVRGDGDVVWPVVIDHAVRGTLQRCYEGGRVDADRFVAARWDLLPPGRYMWGSVQTVRGCPKHCSFCSVWRTDGQKPRQRAVDSVIAEIIELRRQRFRFVALADDNFYPVALADLAMAERQGNVARLDQLRALRAERFELMARLAELPPDMVFFTQITMEAAEDEAFLDAMRRANIKGALVGVEAVTPEGLKDVYKGFNYAGEALVERLRKFRQHGVHVLGSFIFGLPSDRASAPFRLSTSGTVWGIRTFREELILHPSGWEWLEVDRRKARFGACAGHRAQNGTVAKQRRTSTVGTLANVIRSFSHGDPGHTARRRPSSVGPLARARARWPAGPGSVQPGWQLFRSSPSRQQPPRRRRPATSLQTKPGSASIESSLSARYSPVQLQRVRVLQANERWGEHRD